MRILLFAITLAASAFAQDVGMGARRGTGARLEAPYKLDIVTPHTKWARPLAGGTIRVLAVPSVSEGRTLVELAQRVDLDLTTVSIDSQWDTNKWTMAFGRDYGARAEKGNLSLLYGYLEQELTGPGKFDVIILHVSHGWERLTPASREALARRVSEGTGLIVVRPGGGDMMPLEPLAPIALPADGSQVVEPGAPRKSTWTRTADHYITRAIPVESFPFEYLQTYPYRAATGASVLVQTEQGQPVVATRQYGQGRVVAFGYRNSGLSWYMPMSARGFVSKQYWEYFYALLVRSILWAAHREPLERFTSETSWELKDEQGVTLDSGKGSRPPLKTRTARHFLELRSHDDFHIEAIDMRLPEPVVIDKLAKDLLSEGETLDVNWSPAAVQTVEIIDGLGRVIARSEGRGAATLKCGTPLTHSGFVRVGDKRTPIRFAASNRAWSDYEVIMPWYGPGSWQPWMDKLDDQFRAAGITTLSNPDRNFKVIASAGLHDVFGVYAYRNQRYAKRKAAYAETKDKQYLTRDVVLQDPGFDAMLRSELTSRLSKLAPLKPLAYYLADESSLTSYTDPFDVDWSPVALAGFREWLKREYKTLEAVNASWGTSFREWDSVVPMTTEEAQKHGNYAAWSDHRVYMEAEFVRALGKARDIVREIDPGAPASISGTQVPTAHNGANWYELDRIMDYLQPYSGGSQDAMHHLFRPGILLSGFTGYGAVGDELHRQVWERLFYGHTGASIFWHYTVLNPDLTLSEQGKAMAQTFGRLQSGIGRIFMNSTVEEDGVAIHFSMASIRGAWIQDGVIRPNVGNVRGTSKQYMELTSRRDAWVKALEQQGVQFRFLATPQIESGELDRYKVLILPYSIALSDAEATAIEGFIKRGGVVYADDQTGRMDERCHWRKQPLFAGERTNVIRQAPGPVAVKPAFAFGTGFLTTVRSFGTSRLVGALPRERGKLDLPPTSKVRYDLVRGGPAASTVETSADQPLVFVERATRISRLEITPSLEIRLFDERKAPVDRSVVHIDVLDPAGNLVRAYSGNVTVRDGRATFHVPFALSDSTGKWTLRVRDAVSGLTAERTVTR